MSLAAGQTLVHYRIAAAIGAGGMGEVYRATDTKLGRDVAIKVLPSDLAADPERLARFEREARLLASLNHPSIAHVYGFESATLPDGPAVHFLAMELVEGEDLADRLKRGPIRVEEALEIAKQIAEALEEAHEHGIVHRDLKPANVKIASDEKVKVLDFGLAKALSGDAGDTSKPDVSHSPTLTRAGTEAGMILGTAAYMSPEQARGKAVDKRADIWAFGVVLYEMLTGQRLFAGETVSDVLAGVLKTEIDIGKLPERTPPPIRALLRRCLERNPKNRLHHMADARIVLDEVLRGEAGEAAADLGSRRRPQWLAALPWTVAALCLLGAMAIGLRHGGGRAPLPRPLTAFGILMPEDYFLALSQSPLLDVSADGRTLVFAAQGKRTSSLFRRSFDRMAISRIEGTDGAENPMLSPDGRSIAFFSGGMLRKIAPDGGTSVAVAEARAPRGLSWAPDGSLFFSPLYTSPLFKVVATGGKPVAVTTLDAAKGERSHRWPQVLPDGRTVIFTVGIAGSPGDYDGANIDAQRLDTGERRTVVRGARMARYTAFGYLLYQRAKTLLAVKFNPERLETVGEPFTIQEGVGGEPSSGAGYFSVSNAGVVAVAPEASIPNDRVLVLADHAGRETPLTVPACCLQSSAFLARRQEARLRHWQWKRRGRRRLCSRAGLPANAAPDFRPGARHAPVDSRRTPARLYERPQRRDGHGNEGGRWQRRGGDAGEQHRVRARRLVARGWPATRGHQLATRDQPPDPRPWGGRQDDAALRQSCRRCVRRGALSGWSLRRLHLHRDRHGRGRRRDLSHRPGQVAGLGGGRGDPGLVPRRTDPLLRRR